MSFLSDAIMAIPLLPLLIAIPEGSPLADGPTRAVLLMALLAFVVLGIGLVAATLLGGRWARRAGKVDLRQPLPLRRSVSEAEPREPAMMRGLEPTGEASTDATIDTSASDTRTD